MCTHATDEDVSSGRTDSYVDSLTDSPPSVRRSRRRLSTESYSQPNTPTYLKDNGVISEFVCVCGVGIVRVTWEAERSHARVCVVACDSEAHRTEGNTRNTRRTLLHGMRVQVACVRRIML